MVTRKRVYPPPTESFGVGRRPRHFGPGPKLRAIKLLVADLTGPRNQAQKTSGTHKCFAPLSHKAPIRNGF